MLFIPFFSALGTQRACCSQWNMGFMCGHVHPPTHVPSQRPASLPLCKVNMSNSITIRKGILQGSKVGSGHIQSTGIQEKLKLVGSMQKSSNPDQKVEFNHYKKTYSSGVRGRVRSYSIYIRNTFFEASVS